MSFYEQTTRAVHRAHEQFATSFTVVQFTWDETGGTNEYADGGDWTASKSSVTATLNQPDDPRQTSGPDGDDVAVDIELYVQPDAIDVELGIEDETRATEFIDTDTGARYRAVNVRNQRSLLAIDCSQL
jgi:hypothetical protein